MRVRQVHPGRTMMDAGNDAAREPHRSTHPKSGAEANPGSALGVAQRIGSHVPGDPPPTSLPDTTDKNSRGIAALRTGAGVIYFIEAVGAGLVKIGFTDRMAEDRLKELQTGCPHRLRLVGHWDEPASHEKFHHKQWQHLRATGEWFRIDDQMRGYLWWLEHGKQYTDTQVHCAKGDAHFVGLDLKSLAQRVAAMEEWGEHIEDQMRSVRRIAEEAIRRHADGGRIAPRPQAAHDFADCRM